MSTNCGRVDPGLDHDDVIDRVGICSFSACSFAVDHDLFQVGFHYAWHQQLLDDFTDRVGEIVDTSPFRLVASSEPAAAGYDCSQGPGDTIP